MCQSFSGPTRLVIHLPIHLEKLSLLNFAIVVGVCSFDEPIKICILYLGVLVLKCFLQKLSSFISVQRPVVVGVVLAVDFI